MAPRPPPQGPQRHPPDCSSLAQTAAAHDGDGGTTRAILLSDVGGKQLAAVSCGDYKAHDLRSMVKTAIGAIYGLGVSPSDANLVHCHVVDGNRVIIVDHEQDAELDDEKDHHVEELIDAKVDSIIERYWNV